MSILQLSDYFVKMSFSCVSFLMLSLHLCSKGSKYEPQHHSKPTKATTFTENTSNTNAGGWMQKNLEPCWQTKSFSSISSLQKCMMKIGVFACRPLGAKTFWRTKECVCVCVDECKGMFFCFKHPNTLAMLK